MRVIDFEKKLTAKELLQCVSNEGFFLGIIDNIVEFEHLDVTRQLSLEQIYDFLEEQHLDILPKLVKTSNGITVANLQKSLTHEPVVIFKRQPSVNKKSSNMRYALLIAKVSALMAKIDGEVKNEEISQLKESISGLTFLTENEAYFVFIRAIYWFFANHSLDLIIEDIESLNDKAKLQIVSVAKDIAISDADIDKAEVNILRELYRKADIPTKTVVKDLKKLAKSRNINIAAKGSTRKVEHTAAFEVDDSLDRLLDDFSDF